MEDKTIKAIAIIADVIDSRKNTKEKELQDVGQSLDKKYKQDCIIPFTVRSGDELFAVLSNYSKAYSVLKDLFICSEHKDIPLYVGIGIGTVFEGNKDANNINGSAIWHASDALEQLKSNDSSVKYFKSKSGTFKYAFFANDETKPDMLINFMTAFILEKIDSRTDKQAEVIRMYEAHPDNTLEEIGQKLGYQKNPGINVSKTLARSNYHFTHAAEHELIQLLKQIQD